LNQKRDVGCLRTISRSERLARDHLDLALQRLGGRAWAAARTDLHGQPAAGARLGSVKLEPTTSITRWGRRRQQSHHAHRPQLGS